MKDIRFCCKNVATWNGGKGWWTEQVGGCQDTVMLLFQAYLWLYTVRCLTRSLSYKNLPSKQMVWYCILLQNPRGRPCDLAVEASQMLSKDDKTGRTVLQKQPLHSFALESQIDAPELLLCKRKTCYLLSSGACWLWLACHAYVGPGFDAVLNQVYQLAPMEHIHRRQQMGQGRVWAWVRGRRKCCRLVLAEFYWQPLLCLLPCQREQTLTQPGLFATSWQGRSHSHGGTTWQNEKKNTNYRQRETTFFFVFPTFWTVNDFTCVTILFRIYL